MTAPLLVAEQTRSVPAGLLEVPSDGPEVYRAAAARSEGCAAESCYPWATPMWEGGYTRARADSGRKAHILSIITCR